MKKSYLILLLIFILCYMLIDPVHGMEGVKNGLLLWYDRILPALLPFSIISYILVASDNLSFFSRILHPVIKKLIPVSPDGVYPLLAGFLFGFPLGSKIIGQLSENGQLRPSEAQILLSVCNNISPVFVTSFILYTQLKLSHLSAVTLLILYFPALLLGSILLSAEACRTKGRTAFHAQKQPASGSQMNFKIIDTGIMDGFETLTRLGGYIMLFSMTASLLQKLPIPHILTLILTGMVEITNGIAMLPDSSLPQSVQYVLAVVYTAFGGLSGIAQTSSMIRDTPLSIKRYCIAKLLLAACCGLLACLVSQIFHL